MELEASATFVYLSIQVPESGIKIEKCHMWSRMLMFMYLAWRRWSI
jgi:hypothetical protein